MRYIFLVLFACFCLPLMGQQALIVTTAGDSLMIEYAKIRAVTAPTRTARASIQYDLTYTRYDIRQSFGAFTAAADCHLFSFLDVATGKWTAVPMQSIDRVKKKNNASNGYVFSEIENAREDLVFEFADTFKDVVDTLMACAGNLSGTFAGVSTDMSVTGNGVGAPIKLVNDEETPANDYYYGTDSTGTKGWYPLPAGGGGGGWYLAVGDTMHVAVNEVVTFQDSGGVTITIDTVTGRVNFYVPPAQATNFGDGDDGEIGVWDSDTLTGVPLAQLIWQYSLAYGNGTAGKMTYWVNDSTIAATAIDYSATQWDADALTGSLRLPSGTTGQRPTPDTGDLRYNSSLGDVEFYTTQWRSTVEAMAGTFTPGEIGYYNSAGVLTDTTITALLSIGGAPTGSGVANRVAYWSGTNTLTGHANFLYGSNILTLGDASELRINPMAASTSHRVSIGTNDSHTGNNGIAIGYSAQATEYDGVALGPLTTAYIRSVAVGYNSTASGQGSIAVKGTSSATNSITLGGTASANYAVSIGQAANATFLRSISIGNDSDATRYGIALGYDAQANQDYSIAIGYGSVATATNQFVCGGDSTANAEVGTITDVYFGSGVQKGKGSSYSVGNGDGESYTIHGSGGGGTNRAGGNITIAGGKGTGSGTPGVIIFSTATAGGSGSTLQSLTERARINGTGIGIGVSPSYKLDVASGGLRLGGQSAAPTGASGVMYYDTDDNWFLGYNGTSFHYFLRSDDVDPGAGRLWFQNATNTQASTSNLLTWNGSQMTVNTGSAVASMELTVAGNIYGSQTIVAGDGSSDVGVSLNGGTGMSVGIFRGSTSGSGGPEQIKIYNHSNVGNEGHTAFYGTSSVRARVGKLASHVGVFVDTLYGLSAGSNLFIRTFKAGVSGVGSIYIWPESGQNEKTGGSLYVRAGGLDAESNGVTTGTTGNIFFQLYSDHEGQDSSATVRTMQVFRGGPNGRTNWEVYRLNTTATGIKVLTLEGDTVKYRIENIGTISTTTDASGDVTVTHNMGTTPTVVLVTPTGTTAWGVSVHTIGATTFKVRFYDLTTGLAVAASTAVTATWLGKT